MPRGINLDKFLSENGHYLAWVEVPKAILATQVPLTLRHARRRFLRGEERHDDVDNDPVLGRRRSLRDFVTFVRRSKDRETAVISVQPGDMEGGRFKDMMRLPEFRALDEWLYSLGYGCEVWLTTDESEALIDTPKYRRPDKEPVV